MAFAALLVWCTHYDRWTPAAWRIPTYYTNDAHESLARLKAASEGDTWPLLPQEIERLGAPFGAAWNAYPTPDKPLMLLLGAFVNAVGLFSAANLGLLLAHVSAALAFYFVARWLRCRWEWSAAGALVFAFAYPVVHRGLAHFSLVFNWTVPLGVLAVALVAHSRRLRWKSAGAVVCLGVALGLGVSNPYNLFFWLQLLGWALLLQWLGPRRRINLEIGVAAGVLAVAAFFAVNAEHWIHIENPEGRPLLARNYAGTEMYALKPVEMFIPPAYHHSNGLAFFGHRYARWSSWRGEVFLPYLGLVGIVGILWLAWSSLRRVVAQRPLPSPALAVLWIVAFATVGGVTNILAFFLGFQVFRATNRAVIFISAIVLCYLVVRLSRATARRPAGWRLGAAALVAVVGVWDQLPRPDGSAERAAIVAAVQADEAFGRRLEAALPEGAMIFQLPVLGFPEVAPPHRLGAYEHFRPYLATRTLRFSYGAAKSRARGGWQRDLEQLPMRAAVPLLQEYGFSGLYINRKGYRDRGEGLLRELDQLGYRDRLEAPDGDQIVVRLQPAENPRPPLGASLTYGHGWHNVSDRGVRWAYEDAVLSYYNPYPHPLPAVLKFTVQGVALRPIVVEFDGRLLRELAAGPTPQPVAADLSLRPGVNLIHLRSSERAIRRSQGQNQLRSFGVSEASVHVPAE